MSTRKVRMPKNPLESDDIEATADVDSVLGSSASETAQAVEVSADEDPAQEESPGKLGPQGKAMRALQKRVLAASAAGLIPSPFIDLAMIGSIQLELIRALAKIYQVPYRKSLGKSLLAGLTGGVVPVFGAPTVGSLLKLVPVVGMSAAALSVSALGAATTYAVGRTFIMHFETGGTLLDFDVRTMRAHFRREFANASETSQDVAG
ncbi:MAG: GTPase [Desulfuromonas sp.]|nr:MAG: GTPase [Desulfuromonas sp.]